MHGKSNMMVQKTVKDNKKRQMNFHSLFILYLLSMFIQETHSGILFVLLRLSSEMNQTMTPFRKTNLVRGVDTFMTIMPGVDSVCQT